jgi:hypothetical protein
MPKLKVALPAFFDIEVRAGLAMELLDPSKLEQAVSVKGIAQALRVATSTLSRVWDYIYE